jgi:hypothetical protein
MANVPVSCLNIEMLYSGFLGCDPPVSVQHVQLQRGKLVLKFLSISFLVIRTEESTSALVIIL